MAKAASPAAGLPRITIATICWNAAETIRDTLDSLQAQNYPNLEFLVIDGGSKDDTLKIVRSYKALNATIDPGPDEGPNHAYQKAILQAKGDLFGLLNADDILEPGALHAVASAWQKNPVDMLTLPVKIVSMSENNTKTFFHWQGNILRPYLKNIIRDRICPNARFCRPSLLQALPVRYKLPNGTKCTAADLDLYLRLTRTPFTHTELTNTPAYVYRQHEGSLTFNTNPAKQLALTKEAIFIHQRFIREYYKTFTLPEWAVVLGAQARLFRIYAFRCLQTCCSQHTATRK